MPLDATGMPAMQTLHVVTVINPDESDVRYLSWDAEYLINRCWSPNSMPVQGVIRAQPLPWYAQ